jgi:hypothetical protein
MENINKKDKRMLAIKDYETGRYTPVVVFTATNNNEKNRDDKNGK